jgi:hypothetical protein
MDTNLIISIGGTILSSIITSAGAIALINYRLKKLEERIDDLSKEVKSITADVLVLKTERAVEEKYTSVDLSSTENKYRRAAVAARRLGSLVENRVCKKQ